MNLGRKVGERLRGESAGGWAFYRLGLGAEPSSVPWGVGWGGHLDLGAHGIHCISLEGGVLLKM